MILEQFAFFAIHVIIYSSSQKSIFNCFEKVQKPLNDLNSLWQYGSFTEN